MDGIFTIRGFLRNCSVRVKWIRFIDIIVPLLCLSGFKISFYYSGLYFTFVEVLFRINNLIVFKTDIRMKVQKTLSKIINEGNGGFICILL